MDIILVQLKQVISMPADSELDDPRHCFFSYYRLDLPDTMVIRRLSLKFNLLAEPLHSIPAFPLISLITFN